MTLVEVCGPDAWERVRAVRLRALADAPEAFWVTVGQERATPVRVWRERLTRADAVTVLGVVDGADVGMAVGAPHHDDPADAGLYAVWVAPEARGLGVGEALVTAVVDWAVRAAYRRLRLDVGDRNAPAVALYARLGFAPTGGVGRMPPPRDDVTEHERARLLDS
jgi:GNAT superfamily N-acetyltransferase